jgi:hypothetical protein
MGGGRGGARKLPLYAGVMLAGASYFAVVCFLSWRLNLWRDEMYSLHSTSGSVGFAFDQATHFELQPPVYFVVLSLWRSLDASPFFARSFSALCGAAAVLTTGALSRRILPRANPALAAAVIATHPLVIWAGSEIRVYALTILLSALLALVAWVTYLEPVHPARSARWGYVALAVLALHTQYYLGLLLVGYGVALLARAGWRKFALYAQDMAVVLVACAPLFWMAKHQLQSYRADVGTDAGVEAPLRLVWSRYESYLFTFNDVIDRSRSGLATLRAARWAYRAMVGAGIVALFVAFRRSRRVARAPSWPLLAVIGVYAPGMLLLARATGPLAVGPRHTVGLLVPLLLAALSIPAALGPRASAWAAAFLVASNVPALGLLHLGPLAKECDCRRVADVLVTHESDREPILVFPSEEVMPMSAYYHGHNHLVPLPRPPDLRDWDQSTFRLIGTREVEEALRNEGSSNTLWVYTGTAAFAETVGRPMLEKFLANGYVEDARHEFANGELLRHFHRGELTRE